MLTQGSRATGMVACFVHQLRLFFVALQFFTRMPVPRWVGFDPQWLSQASRYFPAVGLVVGAFAALAYALASALWPPIVAVLLSTSTTIWLTGAFHEDGFADTCDGLGGGMTRERVLEIMKDSRIGAYGASAGGHLVALLGTDADDKALEGTGGWPGALNRPTRLAIQPSRPPASVSTGP